ncbi:alginate lyase family protein [candidate division KSB1 bacterium]|nr:alginate lyase family protein [candidate division KSB1 bacterium]
MIIFACHQNANSLKSEMLKIEKERVLAQAKKFLQSEIKTITDTSCTRSRGGIHDFYSEGDYWWPDSTNPGGPYIRKDGYSNPDNFVAHRIAMRQLSLIVPSLVAAHCLTKDTRFTDVAKKHLRAWFINEKTRMNPNLLYSQAIYGRVTGRGIGIIDAIHLVEVVKACMVMEKDGLLEGIELEKIKNWFKEFNIWLTTHPYGIEEKLNGNNHSTCWAMQVAMYAQFTQNDSLLNDCCYFYKQVLLPTQLKKDGSFPKELARTKPYSYSLFNLDAMCTLLHILSSEDNLLWEYTSPDSLNIRPAIEFMYPYIQDKTKWPYQHDVMYFEDWPMRHPSLLFGYLAYSDNKYFELWKKLKSDSDKDEVIRNFFIRQPLLWIN